MMMMMIIKCLQKAGVEDKFGDLLRVPEGKGSTKNCDMGGQNYKNTFREGGF
jgi:hypothetical protein